MVKIAEANPHSFCISNEITMRKEIRKIKELKQQNVIFFCKVKMFELYLPGDHDIIDKREETLKQRRDQLLGSLNMHKNLMNKSHQQVSIVVVVVVVVAVAVCAKILAKRVNLKARLL